MTTTDTGALIERIARAIHLDDLAAGEAEPWGADEHLMAWYRRNAAAVLPIVAEEVRKAKAEALRDAADSVHDNMATPYCRPCHREDADLLRTIADQIEAGDQA